MGKGEGRKMRLRARGRWLKHGGRTLQEEGIRDWECVVVVMGREGEDWRNCVREADGVSGAREGWPYKGKIRTPLEREGWLRRKFDGLVEGWDEKGT